MPRKPKLGMRIIITASRNQIQTQIDLRQHPFTKPPFQTATADGANIKRSNFSPEARSLPNEA